MARHENINYEWAWIRLREAIERGDITNKETNNIDAGDLLRMMEDLRIDERD